VSMTVGELVAYMGLDDADYNRGVDNAGRRFGALGDTVHRVADGIIKVLKVGVATAMAGVTYTIAKGFSRLKSIDDARFKLEGLGHSAETIETVMDNALQSVLGTSFGLQEAVSTAAMALAAGAKPGEDLERQLRLVGDAAAIAGTSMIDMADIFNAVQSSGSLTMLEVRRLAQQGIPILQWLAEEYGVTAAEAKKMVSEGKVDFAAFERAIETHIGGAALKMGESWSGAFENMKWAASRLGAVLLGPVFGQMKTWFAKVTDLLDGLTAKAKPWGEKFGQIVSDAIERIGRALRDIKDGFVAAEGGATMFIGVWERAGAFLSDTLGVFRSVWSTLLQIKDGFLAAIEGVSSFGASSEQLGGLLYGLLDALSPLKNIWPLIIDAAKQFIDFLTGPEGQPLVSAALDLIGQGAELLRTVFEGVWPIIQSVVQGFIDFFNSPAGSALIQTLLSAIGTVLTILQQVFETVWPIIQQVVQTFIDFWNGETGQKLIVALMKGIELALRVLEDVFNAVWPIIESVVQEFIDFFNSPEGQWLIESLVDLLSAAVEHMGKIWEEIWPAMEVALKVVAVMISNNLKVLEGAIWLVVHALQKLKDLYEWFKKSGAFSLSGGQTGPSGGGGFQARAAGGLITRPELALIGEAGPELLLPLSRPARTQQLLSRAGLVGSDPALSVTITGPINIHITGQGREAGEAAADGFLTRLATAGVAI
jgi:tape measure domain-containing protein